MEKVRLNSRYGLKNYLRKIEDHKWVLTSTIGNIRLGIDSKDHSKYTFIDPPGGPFITKDSLIDEIDEIVESIDFDKDIGYIITTKGNDNKG